MPSCFVSLSVACSSRDGSAFMCTPGRLSVQLDVWCPYTWLIQIKFHHYFTSCLGVMLLYENNVLSVCLIRNKIVSGHTVIFLKHICVQCASLVSLAPLLSHTYLSFSNWEPITSFLVSLQGTHHWLDRDLMYSVKPIKAPFIPLAHSAQFISSQ